MYYRYMFMYSMALGTRLRDCGSWDGRTGCCPPLLLFIVPYYSSRTRTVPVQEYPLDSVRYTVLYCRYQYGTGGRNWETCALPGWAACVVVCTDMA